MAKHHYVYALTDPTKLGAPFYVGKGSGDRKVQHFRSVSKEMAGAETSEKYKTIKRIRDAGLQPSAIILSHHTDEEDALKAERLAIEHVGRDTLVNKSNGGEGVKVTKKRKVQRPDIALTAMQEDFCQLVVAARNGTASDCYRLAYPNDKSSKKTINEHASRLMADDKIKARLFELRAPAVGAALYSLQWCLDMQRRAADLAEETGNAGAVTGAVREIGKLGGHYVERVNLNVAGDLAMRLQQGRARLAQEDTTDED